MSMLRTAFASTSRAAIASTPRAFHTSPISRTVTERVAEVADKVNKKVGRGLASAIERGEEVTEKTKQTVAPAVEKTKKASGMAAEKTKETANVAGQKANQTTAGLKQGTQDFKEDVKKEARK